MIVDCHGHVSAPAQLWLSQVDREKFFAGNARKAFKLKV